jgi:hypothetical protein
MPISQHETRQQPAADDPAARILAQWAPVIEDMVAACGDEATEAVESSERLEPFLQQMGEVDDWRALVAVLRRMLAGERDEAALVEGLDATDHLIVDAVLERLALTPPLPRAGEEPEAGATSPLPHSAVGEGPGAGATSPLPHSAVGEGPGVRAPQAQQVTLDELLALVARACQPDERDLNAQMYVSARRMAEAEAAPAWQRALGNVLMAILDGERDPDLAALPEALADKVRAVLRAVGV